MGFRVSLPPFGGLIIVLTVLVVVVSVAYLLVRTTSVTVDGDKLAIRSLLYGREVPLSSVNADGIRMIDFTEDRDYRIVLRTNGIGFLNIRIGWMRLRNGERALVFLTSRKNIVLIPTDDFLVMYNSSDVDNLLNALRAGQTQGRQ
ncbi:MAG: PH domain-containing protein [Treponema sp.]|nr:PH domain-containing protein [Treponema sp.]